MKVTPQTNSIRRAALRIPLVLSVLTGLVSCDVFEDEGDEEPVQGTYEVSTSLNNADLSLNPSVSFYLRANWTGDHPPAGWETNPPMWTGVSLNDAFQVVINDPTERSTLVSIIYTGAGFVESSLFNPGVSQVIFRATNPPVLPDGSKAATNSAAVEVSADLGLGVKEETVVEPMLTAIPGGGAFQEDLTGIFTFLYKGPDTAISSVALGGPEPARFALSATALPSLKSKQTFTVAVTYILADGEYHYATLIVTTANGADSVVFLKGYGNPIPSQAPLRPPESAKDPRPEKP